MNKKNAIIDFIFNLKWANFLEILLFYSFIFINFSCGDVRTKWFHHFSNDKLKCYILVINNDKWLITSTQVSWVKRHSIHFEFLLRYNCPKRFHPYVPAPLTIAHPIALIHLMCKNKCLILIVVLAPILVWIQQMHDRYHHR